MNLHDALHHDKRAAKVDAQCDKLVTELSSRLMFSSYSELFIKSRQLSPTHLHLAPSWGDPVWVLPRSLES